MLVLETPRLALRHFTETDLPELAALYADPEVRRYFPGGTLSLAETREELNWHLRAARERDRLGLWATICRGTGALIGRCGLIAWTIEDRPEVEVAYLIARQRWGEGLGAEAAGALVEHGFDSLGLDRLISLIDKNNAASRQTAEKAGLRFERTVDVEGTAADLFAIEKPSRAQELREGPDRG